MDILFLNHLKKTNPRFVGQNFDTYVQKSNNLQIWNEEITPSRRYVIIKVDKNDMVCNVKVITGADLSDLDTTGKLTSKYQAILKNGTSHSELISKDTETLIPLVNNSANLINSSPVDIPCTNSLLSIESIFEKLNSLINVTFEDAGFDQERNRGAILHKLICEKLGYSNYRDNGQFPVSVQ